MSSIVIIPDELLTGLHDSKDSSLASYTFTLNQSQRDIVNRLYDGKTE